MTLILEHSAVRHGCPVKVLVEFNTTFSEELFVFANELVDHIGDFFGMAKGKRRGFADA